MATKQVIYAHITIGAYNPTETTELIQPIRKTAVPQKAQLPECSKFAPICEYVTLLTACNRDVVHMSHCILNPSMIMGFKFQLLPRTKGF